jgi:hypothetical protein
VLAEIKACGYFVRTQVPYREICKTERKFVADMVLALQAEAPMVLESQQGKLLIIEVTAHGDEFLHGEEYQKRMEEKKALAEAAGILLVELTELDPWRDFIASLHGDARVPEGAYRWLAEKERQTPHGVFGEVVLDDKKFAKPRFPFWDPHGATARFIARRDR